MSTNPIEMKTESTSLPEPYVPPEKAAEFLGLTRLAVIRLARAGKIPSHPIQGSGRKRLWRFKLSELDRHMQGGNQKKEKERTQ